MANIRHLGATSNTVRFTLKNKTTGQGLTGLTTATSGLIISTIADNEASATVYTAAGSTIETITTLGTFATPTATKCRFKQVDSTNHPGLYEFQFANARFAVTSAKRLVISVNDAEATILDGDYEIEFDAPVDVQTWLGTAVLTPAVAGSPLVNVVRAGTAQGGSANTITLDASAPSVDYLYRGHLIHITGGTGSGQTRTIISNNGTTKIVVVDRGWFTNPDNTSTFAVISANTPSLTSSLQVSASSATVVITSGTAQTGTSNTVTLASGSSATNNVYVSDIVAVVTGTGAGQTRTVISYNGTTKVATVDRNWITTPDNTSAYQVLASTTPTTFSDQGVAQAGAATTITLASTASTTNSLYVGSIVTILSGTGSGQTREITAYVGATRVATVDSAWSINPDSTSGYAVIPTVSGTGTLPTQLVASDILYTTLTEGYAADGTAFTLAQALYEICQFLEERSASGTTVTVKKRDGSTTAMTLTLDSATQPTSQTRAT